MWIALDAELVRALEDDRLRLPRPRRLLRPRRLPRRRHLAALPLPLAIAAARRCSPPPSPSWSACRCCACAAPTSSSSPSASPSSSSISILAGETASGHGEPDPVRRPGPARSSTSPCSRSPSAATLLLVLVSRSRFGHGLRSLRENEEAAETLGVPMVRYKLLAFVLSAAIPGMVGGVMALRSTYFVVGQVFDPMISITVIAMAIIGGGDDARGPAARRRLPRAALRAALGACAAALHGDPRRVLIVFVLLAAERHPRHRRQRAGAPRRARRVSAAPLPPLLSVRDLGKRFGGLTALADVSFDVAAGETARRHGRQRRRQDDALQPDRRQRAPERRRHPLDGRRIVGLRARPDLPPRRRPHVPDRQAVPRPERARQRAHRGAVRPRRRCATAAAADRCARPCSTSSASRERADDAGRDADPVRPEAPRDRARIATGARLCCSTR